MTFIHIVLLLLVYNDFSNRYQNMWMRYLVLSVIKFYTMLSSNIYNVYLSVCIESLTMKSIIGYSMMSLINVINTSNTTKWNELIGYSFYEDKRFNW